MRPRWLLVFLPVLLVTSSIFPPGGHAQETRRNVAQSVSESLLHLGSVIQQRREAEERLEVERAMAEAYSELAEAQAEAARARAAADRALAENRSEEGAARARIEADAEVERARQKTAEWAYRILVEILTDEWKATDQYGLAVERYHEIKETLGDEAASQFWRGVQADANEFVERRWVEIAPKW